MQIKEQANHDYCVAKEKMIEADKVALDKKYKKLLETTEFNLKIERSSALHKARIERMTETAKLVDSLLLAAKIKMHETLTKNPEIYKKLLLKLLV